MDNGLSRRTVTVMPERSTVLILIVMDNGLSRVPQAWQAPGRIVLILIVMDNGLSLCRNGCRPRIEGLNPYCNG